MVTAYRLFTHDLRSPIQGGLPLFAGSVPHVLPAVSCLEWFAWKTPREALQAGGLWPTGRPSRLFRLESEVPIRKSFDGLRASTWTIVEEIVGLEEIVRELTVPWAHGLIDSLVAEQMAWRRALARPYAEAAKVEQGLHRALEIRGFSSWKLRRYPNVEAIWEDALSEVPHAGDDSWGALDLVDAAKEKWSKSHGIPRSGASGLWVGWQEWEGVDFWDDIEISEAAGASYDAEAALNVWSAAKRGWLDCSPDVLTVGIRDAYEHGLASARPVATGVLGWSMDHRYV